MLDGCEPHGITGESVKGRWVLTEKIIEATPEDDRRVQASVINVCICCFGPCKGRFVGVAPLCKRCCDG